MRDFIDASTEPCDDFYQFACGNFTKNTIIADGVATSFSKVQLHVNNQLKTIMEDETDSKESRVFELVRKLYKSCMNIAKIEESATKAFGTVMEQIGGFPMVEGEKWNETAFDWIELIHRIREIGLPTNYLFETEVYPIPENSSVRILAISQPKPEFDREELLNLTNPDKYIENILHLAQLAHVDPTTARQESLDILEFERALANISLPAGVLKDIIQTKGFELLSENQDKVSELVNKYPHLRWMDYFNALMPTDTKITPDDVVSVLTPAYFERLGGVLDKTSKRTIANYLVWRSLEAIAQHIGERESPKADCVTFTNSKLLLAVAAAYVRKFPNERSKEPVMHLVENVRSSFIDMVNNVTWMDETTKRAAVDKAKAIVAYIGYPNYLTDIKKLENHYKSLTLNENEFLQNILRLQKFQTDYDFRQLRKPVDKTEWNEEVMPTKIEAAYIRSQNTIQIPAAILQEPFFAVNRPNYLNYAAIGSYTIGHEITHGFDNNGRLRDMNGNMRGWWMPKAESMFLNKSKCFVEQYGNFTVPNIKLNIDGLQTLGENIADNGGLKSAYYAYEKWMERNEAEPNLPGLEQYTPKQMFWITAAQVWCVAISDTVAKDIIDHDVHSPPQFRVIGSFRNSKAFAADFNCALGSKMNPIKKCEIW